MGALREKFGPNIKVEVNEGSTIKDVILKLMDEKFKGEGRLGIMEAIDKCRVIVNGRFSDISAKVEDNAEIIFLTLMAGG
ncbi:MAG: MoaD/ThiS family protein [Candidatus Bathyarchaeia archaeon]